VTVRAGYKLYPFIQSGQLFLIEPYYFGFEGNCCPTAAVQAAYRLTGDRLELLALPDESPQWLLSGPIERRVTFAEATVVAFYRALDAGRFEDAYSFLSPAYQAEHPIAACQAGYSRTRSIEVVTSPGGSFVDGAGRRVYEVLVSLVALDEVATGGLVRRNFTGVWRLVEGEAPGLPLRLDTAQIEILP